MLKSGTHRELRPAPLGPALAAYEERRSAFETCLRSGESSVLDEKPVSTWKSESPLTSLDRGDRREHGVENTFLSSCAEGWHMKRDPGALSRLARNLHITAVKQCNALYDRQPQASAPRTLGTRRVDTEEAIKNPRQSFRWNADAGIGDLDANRGRILFREIRVRISARPQHDCSAGWRVCQGIRDQVAHCPLQERAVQFGNDRFVSHGSGERDSAVRS